MTIHAPQFIYLALLFLALGHDVARHGTARTGKHNAWTTLIATAISFAIMWWGGLFRG